MSIVVDASVLVAALIDSGPQGEWAEQIVAAPSLYAPHIVRGEAASTLRQLESARVITKPMANAAFDDLLRLDLQLLPFDPFAERIWALRANVTCYDAWYVAAAEALQLPLATLDGRLVRSRGPSCRFLSPDDPPLDDQSSTLPSQLP